VTTPVTRALSEAVAVTEAALPLAGYELHPFTRELTARMSRGDITGDQAVAVILTRFLGRLHSPSAASLPTVRRVDTPPTQDRGVERLET
jgi:hypothetical protein